MFRVWGYIRAGPSSDPQKKPKGFDFEGVGEGHQCNWGLGFRFRI